MAPRLFKEKSNRLAEITTKEEALNLPVCLLFEIEYIIHTVRTTVERWTRKLLCMASRQLGLRSLIKQENAAPKCLEHGSAPLPSQSLVSCAQSSDCSSFLPPLAIGA